MRNVTTTLRLLTLTPLPDIDDTSVTFLGFKDFSSSWKYSMWMEYIGLDSIILIKTLLLYINCLNSFIR